MKKTVLATALALSIIAGTMPTYGKSVEDFQILQLLILVEKSLQRL